MSLYSYMGKQEAARGGVRRNESPASSQDSDRIVPGTRAHEVRQVIPDENRDADGESSERKIGGNNKQKASDYYRRPATLQDVAHFVQRHPHQEQQRTGLPFVAPYTFRSPETQVNTITIEEEHPLEEEPDGVSGLTSLDHLSDEENPPQEANAGRIAPHESYEEPAHAADQMQVSEKDLVDAECLWVIDKIDMLDTEVQQHPTTTPTLQEPNTEEQERKNDIQPGRNSDASEKKYWEKHGWRILIVCGISIIVIIGAVVAAVIATRDDGGTLSQSQGSLTDPPSTPPPTQDSTPPPTPVTTTPPPTRPSTPAPTTPPPAAPGDSCETAVPLTSDGTVTLGSTIGAEFHNVGDCGGISNTEPGVWYSVVGTGDLLTATTCFDGFDFDTKISVFSGDCNNLICIDGNDDACGLLSSVTWQTTSGEVYSIHVHGFIGTGDFAIAVDTGLTPEPTPEPTLGPMSDSCTTAAPLTNDGALTLGSTVGTSVDNVAFCGTENTQPGVWYSVVGTGELLTATTCFPGFEFDLAFIFDTQISVFSGTCNNLVCVDGNDDSTCGTLSSVTWESLSGEEYYILVHGFSGTGEFALSVGTGIACESAVGPLPVDGSATIGSNQNGAMTSGVAACGTNITSLGVWYAVTGTGGTVTASTCSNTNFDTKLSVFSGTCDNLICIDGNDDSCELQSVVSWSSTSGEPYFVLVHGYELETGAFELTIE